MSFPCRMRQQYLLDHGKCRKMRAFSLRHSRNMSQIRANSLLTCDQVGGVVSDIYIASERNTAMTLFTAGALFGTGKLPCSVVYLPNRPLTISHLGIGPMVSGFIAYHINWRWTFWVHAIAVFANAIALLLFFRETRGTVLLSRKAKKLNEWYEAREKAGYYGFDVPGDGNSEKQSQRIRWKVKSDEERASILQMIKISLIRPIHMLFTEPVVFFFSLWYVLIYYSHVSSQLTVQDIFCLVCTIFDVQHHPV